jgi:hypothetical protein
MRFLSPNEIRLHNRTSRPVDFEVDIVASRVYPEGLTSPARIAPTSRPSRNTRYARRRSVHPPASRHR